MKQFAIILVLMSLIFGTVLSSTCPAITGGSITSLLKLLPEMQTFYTNRCKQLQPVSKANMDAITKALNEDIVPCLQKSNKKLSDAVMSCLKSTKALTPEGLCASNTMNAVSSCLEKNKNDLLKFATGNPKLLENRVHAFKAKANKLHK